MEKDLTKGNVLQTMVMFAIPMVIGDLLQQCYNIADTLIVGRVLGKEVLAAVGSSYTLMTFLTSILIGLSLGSGVVFSMRYGRKQIDALKEAMFTSFVFIGSLTVVITVLCYLFLDGILSLLQVPLEVISMMKTYLLVIFGGMGGVFLYNYFACLLRSLGDSKTPLVFLGISSILNIGLDILYVCYWQKGAGGAALATILSQYVSGIGIMCYVWWKFPGLRIERRHMSILKENVKEIGSYSLLTCLQQSVMNFGILLVQGIVNGFGADVMAAFAAGVKIDSFAYMPVQDFGNAYATFAAQNYGTGKKKRIQQGFRKAIGASCVFSLIVSILVWVFARDLMGLFVKDAGIIAKGVHYLHIEGAFYFGIGILFLLYGHYRAVGKPGMSVILTVISLGTRVVLAYVSSQIAWIGVTGVWAAVPIGWFLADAIGLLKMKNDSVRVARYDVITNDSTDTLI